MRSQHSAAQHCTTCTLQLSAEQCQRTRKVDHGGAGVGLDAGVCEVVHQAHHRRQDLGVLLLLQRLRDSGGGAQQTG